MVLALRAKLAYPDFICRIANKCSQTICSRLLPGYSKISRPIMSQVKNKLKNILCFYCIKIKLKKTEGDDVLSLRNCHLFMEN